MARLILKGACGIAALLAGGGALIRAVDKVATSESPTMLVILFIFSAVGGIWLALEALIGREI